MPTVQEDIEILKKAQILDKEIYDLTFFVSRGPERLLQLEKDFESKKAKLNQVEEEVKNLKLAVKEKELELGKKDGELKKLDQQLSQVKTNKEYSALQQEIASLKADKGMLEDKILSDWEVVDRLQFEREEERKRLAQEEETLKREKKALEEETKKAKDRIQQLKEERKETLKPVSSEAKDLYEKILSKREGIAIAKIEGENCGGCQYLLRPQIINEVRLLEKLTLCESCTRILFYEP